MKKQRGRPIMAAIFGFVAGLFGSISLLAFGIIPVESPVVTVLPFVMMIAAFALAMWAPIGAKQEAPAAPVAAVPSPAVPPTLEPPVPGAPPVAEPPFGEPPAEPPRTDGPAA